MTAKKSTNQAVSLLPPEFARILGARPTLWFESNDDYDSLLSQFITEYDPKGATDFLLIKDLADVTWEALRMRRLKAAAIHGELPDAAWGVLYKNVPGLRYPHAEPSGIGKVVRFTIAGDKKQSMELSELMKAAGVTHQEIHYLAYKRGLKAITAIDQAVENAERRRDRVLRMLEDRRKTVFAMKSLVDKSSDVTDLDTDQAISAKPAA